MIIDDSANERSIVSENIGKTSLSIPLVIDAGFRFAIKEKIQFKLLSSYYQSKVNYQHNSYIIYDTSSEISETFKETKLNIPLKAIHFSIGVIYTL
jgi:hypothetical protein